MKDRDQFLETLEIPPIPKKDVMETVVKGIEILSESAVQKQELHLVKQIILICKFHFPMVFMAQLSLSVILLLMLAFIRISEKNLFLYESQNDLRLNLSIILIVGSVLFAMITSFELMRNQFNHMWECERACMVRTHKIIVFKLFVLTVTTFILFALVSLVSYLLGFELSYLSIFTLGIAPYVCITTCIVQLIDRLHGMQSVLCVYVLMAILFISLAYVRLDEIVFYLQHYAAIVLLWIMIISVLLNAYKIKRLD